MVTLLAKLFIKDRDNVSNPRVRSAYGTLCSILGICLNILMTVGKIIAGKITGSISMVADALNNLSDAGSGVITFVGFKSSEKREDREHPFGHGRIEYVSGLVVAMLVILMGFELMKESITKLIHPQPVTVSIAAYIILSASVLVKFYMAYYNSKIGKKVSSPAMKAVAIDSLSDTIATGVVIATTLINQFAGVNLDAYAGLAVSLLILYAGYTAAKETISPLLGKKPSPELVRNVVGIVKRQPDVLGTHDMMIHDYGPGRVIVSLHAEVPGNKDVFELHDEIDNAEQDLRNELNCQAVIHMDPICIDDEEVNTMRDKVKGIVRAVNPKYSIHDFRMVPGRTHTNLIFDCVVPIEEVDLDGICAAVKAEVEKQCPKCFAVITVEHSYV